MAVATEVPSQADTRGRRWLAVTVALFVPLIVGGALMYAALAAGARGDIPGAAEDAGALAACLWLVSRRPADRSLLRLGGRQAAAAGTAAGAARSAVWLLILPAHWAGSPLPVAGAVALQLVLVAPAEELQFRGILLSRLGEVTRPWVAVVIAAALFTALHAYSSSLLLLPAIAADAVLFSALRARYRSIGSAVTAHGLFNVVAIALPAGSDLSNGRVLVYVLAVLAVDAVAATLLYRAARGARQ